MKRYRHWLAACFGLVLLGVSLLATGCGRDPKKRPANEPPMVDITPRSEPGKKGGGPKVGIPGAKGTIRVSLLTLENPFFSVIGDAIKDNGTQHGYSVEVFSADEDPAKQANQVKDFIQKKSSAIVLSPCESRAVGPVIKEANDAGIPVFTVDIPCHEPGVKIVSQIATDNHGGGKLAGEAMFESLGEAGGKIAIIHYKQAESCMLRVKGFREVVDDRNKTAKGKVEIVAELEGGGAKDRGYKAAEDALQAHPDLRGIFAINDPSALGAYAAVEKAGKTKQIRIIGFDGQPEGKQAIRDGKIYADPIQYPVRMGAGVVRAFLDHSAGKEVPPEILIPTTLYRKSDGMADKDLR